MSQAEWSFTEAQWTAYISQQAGLREEVKVQQLQAACDQALLRRVYDDGGLAALDTEAKLLAKVKKLAVRVVHKTLHMQNLWNMIQQTEEPIRAFASRLTGTAELCDFTMTCSSDTCNHKNSYKDQMIMQALLKGMSDTDIRTRVLSRTQNNELLTLHAIIDYIAAEEASYFSFASLQHPHSRQIHCKARKWQKVCQKNILNQINVSYFVDFQPLKPIKLCLKGFIFAIRIWSFGTFSP